jgi:hypothetical protein
VLARYLKLQLFCLVCGGVGPAFLIAYFALGADREMWMLYVGAPVTAIDVLIPVALTYFGAKSAAKTAELERHGVLALAAITGLTETGTRINDQPLVKVDLHISGPGLVPFDSQDRVIAGVARLGNLTARKLVVLVDPTAQQHRIDWERSALVNGLVPAQVTLDEDNRTYDLSGQAGPLMEILQILKANNVPFNRMVDARSDPVLRRQIQAVVRRAAEQQASAARPAPVAVPQQSIGDRLQDLEAPRTGGALTDQEYTDRRARIISEI